MVLFLAITAIVAGCRNKDKLSKQTNFDHLYFDYTVSTEEGNEKVTCLFQYRKEDASGKALDIDPARVELDGEPIETDSAKLSGFFYEIRKPVDSFAGKHTIVLATPDEEFKNEFEFSPFTLFEELPGKVHSKPFTIRLKNFPATEKSVRLLLLDTAFESRGFNDLVPVVDGKINISESILRTIKNGPIDLELYMEHERPLKQTTGAGGRISITYGLRREFELVD